MIHGLGANMETYSGAFNHELLAKKNILLVDLPGHGQSPKPVTGYNMDEMAEQVEKKVKELAPRGRINIVLHKDQRLHMKDMVHQLSLCLLAHLDSFSRYPPLLRNPNLVILDRFQSYPLHELRKYQGLIRILVEMEYL